MTVRSTRASRQESLCFFLGAPASRLLKQRPGWPRSQAPALAQHVLRKGPRDGRRGDPRMRQGTGYAYGDGEDCISYKCEGCGQRVRVTPDQAQYFRGPFTACSKVCVLRARDLRTQQWHLVMGEPEPSEGAVHDSAAARRKGQRGSAEERQPPQHPARCFSAPTRQGLSGPPRR